MPRVEDQHEKSVKVKCSVPNGLGKLTLISKGDACKGVGRSKRPPKVKRSKNSYIITDLASLSPTLGTCDN